MDTSRLLLAAARYRLDMTSADEVINAAVDLISTPHPPEPLVAISTLSPVETRHEDLQPLIDEALTALNAGPFDAKSAATTVAHSIARDITSGNVEPYEDARKLWRLARAIPAVEPLLTKFVHLASEWEDVPGQRPDIEADIKNEATALIQR
ncbi:hypothetical protein [Saccharopolyspora sp. CA-218241]|uniref:hypothetical protein n=1 Tax=Saccharopolyspora sp. CA-218241 TaxID=3240027 RepID=UPI003D989C06